MSGALKSLQDNSFNLYSHRRVQAEEKSSGDLVLEKLSLVPDLCFSCKVIA